MPVVSVRVRMLAWVIATAAVGMAMAGGFSSVVQLERIEVRITKALEQEVEELRTFAEQGIDPETRQPFANVERLLQVALERNIPDEGQTFITLVDGVVGMVPPQLGRVELESSAELLERVASLAASSPGLNSAIEIGGTDVRYAAIPVSITGQPELGIYIVGYDIGAERAQTAAGLRTFALVGVGAMLLVGLVGWLVAGRLLRPLRTLHQTAQRISDTDLTNRIEVRGHDDVSALGRTFNAMLDRLQTAFETQRNFLDDAGHELRTPLTIVRGHLELLDPEDIDDTRETRTLVLDELDRMHRLVDELVVLAKARRPDFITPGPVQVADLAQDVLDKSIALGDRDWKLDHLDNGVMVGDEQRLTQCLLQLTSNAVKYGQPGDTIAVGGRIDGTLVRLWVRDTGPGVAMEDQERIFARFGRADTGRGVEGSGLGLAIVSAIAAAHGGRVVVSSQPGQGATFELVLPLAGPGAAAAAAREGVLMPTSSGLVDRPAR